MATRKSSSDNHNYSVGGHRPFDVAIIGGGPVGLATAIGLSRAGLSVVVLEGRRDPRAASGRPQLLVARPADIGMLAALGVETRDPRIVSRLATLTATNAFGREVLLGASGYVSAPAPEIRALGQQRPSALVPIAALQTELTQIALGLGVDVRFGAVVGKVRRHVRSATLSIEHQGALSAKMIIVATGASRPIARDYGVFDLEVRRKPQTLIAGVFAQAAASARWRRSEILAGGFTDPIRCVVLETSHSSGGGSALLVSAPNEPAWQLERAFAIAAEEHGLESEMRIEPRTFATQVASARSRVLARDNRAPLIVVGDAAQTGHVFTGLNCFVNMWLARDFSASMSGAAACAIQHGHFGSRALLSALEFYEAQADRGARVLEKASVTHYASAAWVFDGVASAA